MIAWLRRMAIGALLLLALVGVLLVVRSYRLVAELKPGAPPPTAVLLDREGRFYAYAGRGATRYASLAEIPATLRNGLVAAEDKRFYQHPGIDPLAILRALWIDLRAGRVVQGASTLTQQLAKRLFLTPQRTVWRKAQEVVLALMLEQRFSKETILELYLNRVDFGEGAAGVDAAARTYFGVAPSELTVGQSALLAGVVRGPALYSPFRHPEAARERQDYVLERMVEDGYLSAPEASAAREAPLKLASLPTGGERYFVDWVRAELVRRLGTNLVQQGGLTVRTTVDPQVQQAMEGVLGSSQGAVVALDPRTGAVLGMVGGRSYRESQWNRAVLALRQPGSAFKPFVYAAALEQGWQPNWLVDDRPHVFGGYRPANYKDEYWGAVTLKHALVESLNNGSVWLLDQLGVDAGMEMARRLGITHLEPADRHLGLVLGALAQGVSPLELAAAYAPFANGGYRVEPFGILRAEDARGRVWIETEPDPRRVLSPQVASLMTDMMEGVVREGTGTAAQPGRPAAGKTGTTDHLINAWFAGYTPDLLAVVYVGNDDRTPVGGGGGTLAAPIWGRFVSRALANRPPVPFTVPDGVVADVPLDIFTGLRAGDLCSRREAHSLLQGWVPRRYAPCSWGAAQGTGLPASRAAFEAGEVTVASEPGPPDSGWRFPLLLPSPLPLDEERRPSPAPFDLAPEDGFLRRLFPLPAREPDGV
ncbi:transglycosylase domain-containing protein [Limnochorda pilosa]|uniref:Penicillin-binding protein 1A n=1 Tax=Limnochorda pilosa TaxID=1555112 RepID=A0A0K2SPK8_LIMPI|nr:PBP1A family penicillin-binding protein [Limnochorda pilosa]BAS29055.1 penicillin-binding protein 1A [Limnochorda pilosa]